MGYVLPVEVRNPEEVEALHSFVGQGDRIVIVGAGTLALDLATNMALVRNDVLLEFSPFRLGDELCHGSCWGAMPDMDLDGPWVGCTEGRK